MPTLAGYWCSLVLLVVAAGQEDVHQQFEERLEVFITRTVEEEGCSVYRELLRSPERCPSSSNALHLLLILLLQILNSTVPLPRLHFEDSEHYCEEGILKEVSMPWSTTPCHQLSKSFMPYTVWHTILQTIPITQGSAH